MTWFTKSLLAGVALVAMAGAQAQAALIISSVEGGAAAGSIRYNFDDLTLTDGTGPGNVSPQSASPVTGVGPSLEVRLTPNARVVQGEQSGQYARPFLTNQNGVGFGAFGGDQAGVPGDDMTIYLTSGSTGATQGARIELVLPFTASYFGILWGSIDDYNTLQFFSGNNVVGTVTGAQVTATPNGDQNAQGTRYVNITSTLGFDRVVATSTQFAFEFDNVALTAIPEPATLALFGLGLLGLGLAGRAKRRAG